VSGQLALIDFDLRGPLRPGIRTGLRVPDGLGQHQAQFLLCLRRLPDDRCFPLSHKILYGVPVRELNPIVALIAPSATVMLPWRKEIGRNRAAYLM
jgi:hypothetical protein